MLFHVAGTEFGAIASKFSLHGNGGKTRTPAVPLMPLTVALTKPA
jgi:hypothetical protein